VALDRGGGASSVGVVLDVAFIGVLALEDVRVLAGYRGSTRSADAGVVLQVVAGRGGLAGRRMLAHGDLLSLRTGGPGRLFRNGRPAPGLFEGEEMPMSDQYKTSFEQEPHRGPTTPAEEASREAPSVPADDKVKIAEEASREEDA
jgi:hypothetical protein